VLHTADIPKVVGGVSEVSGEVALEAYRRLVDNVHPVSSARAAELTKLLENTYRAVNIAMVNELAQVAHVFDIDVWEVIDAAATKPFGFQPFYPGPGVGGHCIPLDPQFLAWRARELRVATRFIDLAEDVNLHMPDYTVERIAELLNQRGKAIASSRIVGRRRGVQEEHRRRPRVAVDGRAQAARPPRRRARRRRPARAPDRLARHGFTVLEDEARTSPAGTSRSC
jgi:UDP-N-acetyl-D-glucosamine dehydrogenase